VRDADGAVVAAVEGSPPDPSRRPGTSPPPSEKPGFTWVGPRDRRRAQGSWSDPAAFRVRRRRRAARPRLCRAPRGRGDRRGAAPVPRRPERDEPGRPGTHLHVRARGGGAGRLHDARRASRGGDRGPGDDRWQLSADLPDGLLPVARAGLRPAAARPLVGHVAVRGSRRSAAGSADRAAGRGRRRRVRSTGTPSPEPDVTGYRVYGPRTRAGRTRSWPPSRRPASTISASPTA